ncbi:MAG: hypothetical protein HKUEN02_22690 [Anaerolineaceae bacterium]|nr:MAG: hypothetical protein HKUEN02_22690 [Anaerolineaceae bacterium]
MARVRYTLMVSNSELVTIHMHRESGDLDALLVILDENGVAIAQNDDAPSGDTRDAIIENLSLEAGTYTIIASRFQEDIGLTSGDYTLTIEGGD